MSPDSGTPSPKSPGETTHTNSLATDPPGTNPCWRGDLVNYGRDLLCIHSLSGRLLWVNPAPAAQLGYTVEELLRLSLRELVPDGFKHLFDEYLENVERDGKADGLMRISSRSGEQRIWEYHNTLHREDAAEPVVHGMAQDVTERILAEKALRKAHEKLDETDRVQDGLQRMLLLFRTLLDNANDAIEVIDPQSWRFIDVNETECTELGFTREELLGMTVFDIDPAITREGVARTLAAVRKFGFELLESRHRRKDGTEFPVELNIKRVQLDREYIVTVSRDISERKAREERLREYERVVESLDEMIVVLDRGHRYVLANSAFLRYRGLTAEEVVGHRITDVLTTDFYESTVKEKLEECFSGKVVHYELKYKFPTLGERDLDITYLPVEGPHGIDRVASVLRDVTERKRGEEAMRESEERLRLAQEVAQIGTFDRNFVTGESRWTPELESIYGLRAGTFPDTLEKFLELVHPGDREQVSQLLARSMEAGEARGEWRVQWPDGAVHWISSRWRVFQNEQGKPTRVIGIDFDITDRKRIEEELRQAKERLTEEKLYLEHEIDTELGFEEIIGKSKTLKAAMENARRVAASGATVLLLGETGTGKELIARAIHRLSTRAENAFIKMNCAAIPSGLLESELFGAERGAYTGAVSRKVGRLELADKGTLFLDEIGEIALALQPKLLRVLQDQEFERLGGTQTLKVNFRLIAATNRDLADDVKQNQFRRDLFYRLNVFPIHLPPLRERREDIALLVEHYVQKCARRMNKSITSIPKRTMEVLSGWRWPGNVRELENFIERSVILTNGSVLAAPLGELQAREAQEDAAETLAAAERKHILEALRQSHGRVSGTKGAAARLGLKRTTLQSKLKNLNIDPRQPLG